VPAADIFCSKLSQFVSVVLIESILVLQSHFYQYKHAVDHHGNPPGKKAKKVE
jgi:hypothetical protein